MQCGRRCFNRSLQQHRPRRFCSNPHALASELPAQFLQRPRQSLLRRFDRHSIRRRDFLHALPLEIPHEYQVPARPIQLRHSPVNHRRHIRPFIRLRCECHSLFLGKRPFVNPPPTLHLQRVLGRKISRLIQPTHKPSRVMNLSSPLRRENKHRLRHILSEMRIARIPPRSGINQIDISPRNLPERLARPAAHILPQQLRIAAIITHHKEMYARKLT